GTHRHVLVQLGRVEELDRELVGAADPVLGERRHGGLRQRRDVLGRGASSARDRRDERDEANPFAVEDHWFATTVAIELGGSVSSMVSPAVQASGWGRISGPPATTVLPSAGPLIAFAVGALSTWQSALLAVKPLLSIEVARAWSRLRLTSRTVSCL